MTATHFNAIAQTFANTRPMSNGEWGQWGQDVEAIADTLATFNDKFDRARFVEACLDWKAE